MGYVLYYQQFKNMQGQTKGKKNNIPIPRELAGLIRSVSPLVEKTTAIADHLQAIQVQKLQETTSFLRAAMFRLRSV